MQIDLSMQSLPLFCNCHTIATGNLSRLHTGCHLHNHLAADGSVYKLPEKEQVMRAIGRQLFIVALGTVLGASARDAVADEAACQTVLDAIIKQAAVPVHQKISIESAAAPGKPLQSETIRTGDTLYMQIRGQWTSRPYDSQKAASDARAAMQKAEHSCERVKSEAVENQPAELYSVQSKTASGGTESQIWISHASGLPLRQHTVMLEQGNAKSQHDVRFDYANVAAPQGVSR
jgi:hypothetical protein